MKSPGWVTVSSYVPCRIAAAYSAGSVKVCTALEGIWISQRISMQALGGRPRAVRSSIFFLIDLKLHAPAANVLGRAHAELLFAGQAQLACRDAERPADFGNVQKGLILCQIFEPSKDVSMPKRCL